MEIIENVKTRHQHQVFEIFDFSWTNSQNLKKDVKIAIKPMDVERCWSAMLTLGPPKNTENHQQTIGFGMVSVIFKFLTRRCKN